MNALRNSCEAPKARPHPRLVFPSSTLGDAPPTTHAPALILNNTSSISSKVTDRGLKASIVVVLIILLLGATYALIDYRNERNTAARIVTLTALASKQTSGDLPMTIEDLRLLLHESVREDSIHAWLGLAQALRMAESTNGSNFDETIATFATSGTMPSGKRLKLFDLILFRGSSSSASTLLTYALFSQDTKTVVVAIGTVEQLATVDDLDSLLQLLNSNRDPEVRRAVEKALTSLAERDPNRDVLARRLIEAHAAGSTPKMKWACLRLLGAVGGDPSAKFLHQVLQGTDQSSQIAALTALGNWADDSQFPMLVEFMTTQKDKLLNQAAFQQACRFLDRRPQSENLEYQWKTLTVAAVDADSRQQKIGIISGVGKVHEDWAIGLLEYFVEDPDDEVSFKAEQTLEKLIAAIAN